jgi:hypothetical protein
VAVRTSSMLRRANRVIKTADDFRGRLVRPLVQRRGLQMEQNRELFLTSPGLSAPNLKGV